MNTRLYYQIWLLSLCWLATTFSAFAQVDILWDKTLGGNASDRLRDLIPTANGGYVLVGSSLSDASGDKSENSKGSSDYWIVKVDENGNKLWDKTLGGNSNDVVYVVLPAPDGGYFLAGESRSNASGDKSRNSKGETDYWIIKVDENGNKLWDKTLGGNNEDWLRGAISTSDGGYLLTGLSMSNASSDKSENSKGG